MNHQRRNHRGKESPENDNRGKESSEKEPPWEGTARERPSWKETSALEEKSWEERSWRREIEHGRKHAIVLNTKMLRIHVANGMYGVKNGDQQLCA
ncbi:hypothetical protein L6452_14654 [Arctium lappa]|uniref:Uncharacterized protein n=1 Tax=Arctium lappa TaxID=4217 RepID=A0ACB9CLQ6_ARCLA|nr:hypothetical protein L6452_14654 [Arctium lappa]